MQCSCSYLLLCFKNDKGCLIINYFQQFAGLCAENFSWNAWIDAACLGKLALLYSPDKETEYPYLNGLVTQKYTE